MEEIWAAFLRMYESYFLRMSICDVILPSVSRGRSSGDESD